MNSLQLAGQGRQDSLFAVVPFTYADIDSTNFTPAFQLPADAIVIGGFMLIDSATNAATISVGTSADPDALLAATSGAAAGQTAFAGVNASNETARLGAVTDYGVTASVALTQGGGVLVCEYVREGRSHSTQGP